MRFDGLMLWLCCLGLALPMASALPVRSQDSNATCQRWQQLHSDVLVVMNQTDDVRILRNFRITQMYHEIGLELAALMHLVPEGLVNKTQGNWPTIAQWASNTVGWGIRYQWFDEYVASISPNPVTRAKLEPILKLADGLFYKQLNRTSHALGQGNLIVFQEIGYFYSLYGLYFCNQTGPNQDLLDQFLTNFGPNQTLLVTAFQHLYDAHFNQHSYEEIAQLVLLANLYTGWDEQARLQDALTGSMPSAVNITIDGKNITFDLPALTTKFMLNLNMPSEMMWLHEDIPARPWDGQDFGPDLSVITNEELMELIVQFGDDLFSLKGTAADNWLLLSQRIRYIGGLFRSRQDSVQNNCMPFSQAQLEMIANSEVPAEDTLCSYNCCAMNGLDPSYPQ